MARIQYIPNRVIDTNGISDGARLYVYQSGTTTLVPLFSDSALTVSITNPIVAPAGAEVPVFYTSYSGSIRLRVVEDSGAISMDEDPYVAPITGAELTAYPTLDFLSSEDGASAVGFDDAQTIKERLGNAIYVTDARFAGGAKGDGVTDDTAAINAALAQGGK